MIDPSAVDEALAEAIATSPVPGVVGVVADREGERYLGAHGVFDADAGTPMPTDAIFRIASLTKFAVGIVVSQLVEEGRLEIEREVRDYLPAFADVQVLDGFDGDTPILRAPARHATVLNLLTHTSGLTYAPFNADLLRYEQVTGIPMPAAGTLDAFRSPMICDPGTRFTYGMSTDWTGLLVERLTGMPLAEALAERVTGPLGLTDITFEPGAAQRPRVAPVHAVADDGSVAVIGFEFPSPREFDSAGHGLYGSARDYLQIQRVLLGDGEVDGVRLLQPGSIARMRTDQLSPIRVEVMRSLMPAFSCDMDLGPDLTWGLDLSITTASRPGLRRAGSAGWCGTFNSYYWADRETGVTAAVHMQTLPFYDRHSLALRDAFERAVYSAV